MMLIWEQDVLGNKAMDPMDRLTENVKSDSNRLARHSSSLNEQQLSWDT